MADVDLIFCVPDLHCDCVLCLMDDGEQTHILWAEWWFDGVNADVDKLEVQDPGGS